MKNILLGLVFFLLCNSIQSQVVQYEYKEKYAYSKGEYYNLQIDYTKKRFVYRVSCDSRNPGGCISGYMEMYGVLNDRSNRENSYEMEIYDWLYMEFTDYGALDHRFRYLPRPPKQEHIEEGNPKMILIVHSDDSVRVTTGNIFEKEYSKFYSVFSSTSGLISTIHRSKKVKIDKKMFCKELYKYVKEREKLIYNDEVFSPHADYYTRIYRLHLFPTIRCE